MKSMLPRTCLFVLLSLFGGIVGVAGTSASHGQGALESFYVARFYVSDYLPGWSDTILDVQPEGGDVRVRLIRISQAVDFCPTYLVRGVERVIPHTTVRRVAGRDVCAFSSDQVDAALKGAASKVGRDRSDSAAETMVAKCGAEEKEFDFPFPAAVDLKTLDRDHPDIGRLWSTRYDVWKHVFGNKFAFDTPDTAAQKAMKDLGTQILPELKSGKYQRAYNGSECAGQKCANYLAWFLRDYDPSAPPHEPLVGTLVNASSLHLLKYAPPVYPAIALTAHVSGDTTIRVFADPQTGAVTDAEYVSGQKLLSGAAITAAKTWQFDPSSLAGQPQEATLRFELECR
jgi:Gram-negative bacterial TonB protein C-terminal